MSCGEVSDESSSVQGDESTLGTGERNRFGEKRRDFIFGMHSQVIILVSGGKQGGADLTLVRGLENIAGGLLTG